MVGADELPVGVELAQAEATSDKAATTASNVREDIAVEYRIGFALVLPNAVRRIDRHGQS